MSYQTENPYTGELVASYTFATDQEIDATIEKAHQAFLRWRTTGSGAPVMARHMGAAEADGIGSAAVQSRRDPRDKRGAVGSHPSMSATRWTANPRLDKADSSAASRESDDR